MLIQHASGWLINLNFRRKQKNSRKHNIYYADPFDSIVAVGKEYRAYFQIQRYARTTSVTVKGSLTP